MVSAVPRPMFTTRLVQSWIRNADFWTQARPLVQSGRKSPAFSDALQIHRITVPAQAQGAWLKTGTGPSFATSRFHASVSTSDAPTSDSIASSKVTFRDLCDGKVPQHIMEKTEELGFKYPTDAQREALPVLLSGVDCLLHAQTGSGKTLAYLLPTLSKLVEKATVQAVIVVPTRELGMQVAKVARSLLGKPKKPESEETDREVQETKSGKGDGKGLTVMTLLDGGSASRQKKWIKAAPPQLIVGTLRCLSRLIESNHLRCNGVTTVVVDEIDTLLGSAKEGNHLQTFLAVHTRATSRQTIFSSATIPQHNRFLHDCVQNKWSKSDIVHVHVAPEVVMPLYINHRYVVCDVQNKLSMLVAVLNHDKPRAAIIFVNEQNEKGKRNGEPRPTVATAEFLSESLRLNELGSGVEGARDLWEPLILEEDYHINERVSTLSEFRDGRCLLVATDIAARGLDLPEVSHIYNLDLPSSVTSYVHRAGRTGRKPIEEEPGVVTSFIIPKELFVLRRVENETQTQITPFHLSVG